MSSSNSNSSLTTSVPTLTGSNYLYELSDWDNNNDHTLGHILLKMDTNLANHYQDKETAAVVWSGLETQFSNVSVTSIFIEFKAMMDTTIPENQCPAPTFSKMTVHFAHLKEFKYKVPDKVQVMIVLTKVPVTF
ncbi:hypothetical protein BS17DRAFT_813937 [Gyrodon lividus]|nr:hypothetical protein BS17DRAFT_813937 [Gyrodon lividus]